MIHAREDYNNIEELEKKIPADEPVFLLRGQDELSEKVVEYYIKLRQEALIKRGILPDDEDEISEQLLKHVSKMREWPVKKMADLPAAAPEEEKATSD